MASGLANWQTMINTTMFAPHWTFTGFSHLRHLSHTSWVWNTAYWYCLLTCVWLVMYLDIKVNIRNHFSEFFVQIYNWILTLISVHVAHLEISLMFDGFLVSYSTSCLLDVTMSAYLLTPMYECVGPHLNVTQTHTFQSVTASKSFPEAVCDNEEVLKILWSQQTDKSIWKQSQVHL